MSVLRQDPTTRQWVIMAPRRAVRPQDTQEPARTVPPARDERCPFCPGNEDQTPPELLRDPPGPEWRVRVVTNLYPVLGGDGRPARTGPPLFREMPGVGSHEVVIETARHDARMDEMTADQVCDVVQAWRSRYRSLLERPELRAAVVFKNFGRSAGASLTHPHSQIVGTPVFLPRLLRRLDAATRYYDENGSCVYDDVVAAEREAGHRMVDERGRFAAFTPFAGQSPFETWIVPIDHGSSLGNLTDDDIPSLAEILIRVLGAIRRACGDPDYNFVVYSTESEGRPSAVFCWHIKIVPKLSTPAGFELSSAMSINTVAPEDAARELRDVLGFGLEEPPTP
jgi:UDPglucose--hexose-1-phosphate uridylyltransferase